ncbi:hypothetical protein PR048_015229 [Dryococelus australis]|uniref:Uncharacterized protein n=1 Tax=Dryococelus australis TaxID=614101 RepID=A0ABQ9HGV6_9NEOP|nr:hypothetical protein PR048_015229 [Dryococelus australis]
MLDNKISARGRAFQYKKNVFYCTDNCTLHGNVKTLQMSTSNLPSTSLPRMKDNLNQNYRHQLLRASAASTERKKTTEYLGNQVTQTFLRDSTPLQKIRNCSPSSLNSAQEREDLVREKVEHKQLAVLCGKTYSKRHCIFVVLIKIIESSDKTSIVVGNVHTLETVNAKNCSRPVLDSLKKYNIDFENKVAVVADSASFMGKCFDTLKDIMADHVLVQC